MDIKVKPLENSTRTSTTDMSIDTMLMQQDLEQICEVQLLIYT